MPPQRLAHVALTAIENLHPLACLQCMHGAQRIARVLGAPKNLEVVFGDGPTIGLDPVARNAARRRASQTGVVRAYHGSLFNIEL